MSRTAYGEDLSPTTIISKRQCSELFAQGLFGNYVRQWSNLQDVKYSGYKGLLVFRTRASGGGGRTIYDLTVESAKDVSFDPQVNYFNEQLNDQHKHVTFQGEIYRSIRGLELRYSMVNLPMRDALKDHPQHAHGLLPLLLLKQFCCPSGYDCIMELLDVYPDHVIEFTCFDTPCGALADRGWSTIIWEVRSY